MKNTVITIGSTKGGTGKSTIAANLAINLSMLKKKVVCIDADAQKSLSMFMTIRKLNNGASRHPAIAAKIPFTAIDTQFCIQPTLHETVPKIDTDIVLLDVGGFDNIVTRSAFVCTDILIVPVVVGNFDLWALEKIVQVIIEAKKLNPKLSVFFVLNRMRDTNLSKATLAELEKLSAFAPVLATLKERVALPEAACKGLSVVEYAAPNDLASSEFFTLTTRLLKKIEG